MRAGGSPVPEPDVPDFEPLDVQWTDAIGSPRYTFIEGEGWEADAYQLQSGDFFGHQHHFRGYAIGSDITLIQAHTEHWSWFSLGHDVESLERARRALETDFSDRPQTLQVIRVNHRNGDTFDADGWTTVIRLALVLPVIGVLGFGFRRYPPPLGLGSASNRRRITLVTALAGIMLLVRFGGLLIERYLPVPLEVAVVTMYPILVLGPPILAYRFARDIQPTEVAVFAMIGFGAGVVLDFRLIGVEVVPIEMLLHRGIGALGLGGIAAGSAGDRADMSITARRLGVGLWGLVVGSAHLV